MKQRELKFRAWDVTNKRMFGKCFELKEYGHNTWYKFSNEASEDLIWMQYTGRKNKNGKEIYEDDMLGLAIGINSETDETIYKYSVVIYDVDSMQFRLKDNSIPFLPETLETLGNAHENPELLK